jgi:SEFIR domain
MSADGGAKKIFISHASDDPDWPETAVRALATKLRQRGADVLLDYWHERDVVGHNLPLAEWRDWMRQCLDSADHVLCLCTPRYATLARREIDKEPAGRSVAFEAFEIEKRLYKQKQHNKKWCWVLMLDGADSDQVVPSFMQERCPEYHSPSRENLLVGDLVGKQQSIRDFHSPTTLQVTPTEVNPLEVDSLAEQCQLVCDRLQKAESFWKGLRFYDWPGSRPAALDHRDSFVQWLAGASPERAEDAMFATRHALRQCVDGSESSDRMAELAAVSVYCLAACRLVDVRTLGKSYRFPELGGEATHLYCAVLATVLCGGRLELASSGASRLPRPSHAYDIRVPGAGDRGPQVFERAVYQVLLADLPDAPEVALEDAPLTSMQLARIKRRIKTIRRHDRHSLTLVLHDELQQASGDDFSHKHGVPVFVCDPDIADALIGFTAEELVADIEELWSCLHFCNRHAADEKNPDNAHTQKPA